MSEVVVTNCCDCSYHKVIPDPDPEDWFCADDVAVICTHADAGSNPRYSSKSIYAAERQKYRCITVACRPHYISKETITPNWCPLKQPTERQS